MRDGVADHREVLLQRGAQRELDVPVVRLGHQGDHPGAAVAQRRDQRVVGGLHAGPPGRAERGQLGVLQRQLLAGAGEELGVLRVGARPAALDEADPEPVELPGDRQLVGDGEVEPLLLRTVAQGGVVDVERVPAGHRRALVGSSELGSGNKKTSRWTRGWRGGREWSRRAS